MKKHIIAFFVVALFAILFNNNQKFKQKMTSAPIAQKIPYSYTVAKNIINDPYHWLRDPKWPEVKDPQILNHLEAENNYADQYFAKYKRSQELLFQELKGRIKLDDKSTEIKNGNYYYYSRVFADKNYATYYRKLGQDGQEQIILDVNELARNQKYTQISSIAISPDQNLLAYGVDFNGQERYFLKILDLEKNQYLDDQIPNIQGAVVWHENMEGFFYTPSGENWRATKVFYHKLGSKDSDQLIFEEKNHLYQVRLSKSSSKQYLIINASGYEENQIYTLNFAEKNLTPKLFSPLRDGVFYQIEHNKNNFYIHTNDTSKNFRLAITDLQNTESSYWQDYCPAQEDKYLSSCNVTSNYLLLNYKRKGLPSVEVIKLDDKKSHEISFPDAVYTASSYSTNFEEDDIRVGYSSLCRPSTTYSYDYAKNSLSILKEQEVPSGFLPDDYVTERIWTDNNGVKVPSSILYKKSLMKKDGSNPLYLYGYGSYGIGIAPEFRTTILSLVDRGFVYVIAHIRGGDELGHQWYEDAKFLNKKRTFEDFIAVSQDLIDKKYTSKGNIAICGGSAGGMLVGNVINQKPQLYKAAITHVPFVDVLNTMLDETLPLTPGEYKEWGNPQDPIFFDYIKSYSPYDNVKAQNYPNILVTTSIGDPRVGYYEPAKWVANLRDLKTDENLLLFKTNMDAGHQGASGRFDYLKEVAQEYVFILSIFDIKI